MGLFDIFVAIIVLSLSTPTATLQFLNLPSTILVPENTTGGSSLFVVSIDAHVVDPADYLIEYEPSTAAGLFSHAFLTDGIEISLRPSVMLDYETLPNQYEISVINVATPEGSGEIPLENAIRKRQALENEFPIGVLTINITDVNDPPGFDDSRFHVSVLESKVPLNPFIRLPSFAFDEDFDDSLSYEIDAIFPNINNKLLDINSTSGDIILLEEYDVDNNVHPDVLIITVRVIDGSGLSNTAMLFVDIIDVNDNDPVFTGTGNYVLLLPYDYAEISGTEIGYVHADDDDAVDIVTYRLATRNPYFSVNFFTGYIQIVTQLPVGESGVFTFNIVATSLSEFSEGNGGTATANVSVYIVPFCTDEQENGCSLCNQTSSDKPLATTTTTPLPPPLRVSRRKRAVEDGTLNTCPKTTCSRCQDYLTMTCLSGTVPLSTLQNTPTCSSSHSGDVSSVDIRICWILPLVITVAVAAIIIAGCLYTQHQKKKSTRVFDISGNTGKPDVITTVAPASESFPKPVVSQG